MDEEQVAVVRSSGAKGTYVVARKDLPAGTVVVKETAFAWQPLEDHVLTVCHNCMAELPRWAVGCGESGGSCNTVGYCSARCRAKAASVHRIEHKAFLHARDIAAESRSDVTLIKLATRIIALQAQDEAKRTEFEESIMKMVGHEDVYPSGWVESITEAAKGMLSHILKETRLSTRDFVKICCRINTNSHRLHFLNIPQRILGVGLCPHGSLMNHSCYPNCVFHNRGDQFVIRTLRDIKEGEELCYPYIDLYQNRAKRKSELLKTKFFNCNCDRCSEPIATSTDRFLSGFLCPDHKDKNCEGLLILPEDVCPDREAGCTAGCGQSKPEGELVKALKRAEIMLSASQSLYYNQKRTSDAIAMLDKLFTICSSGELQLHPLHPTLFQAHVDAINVCDALGETQKSLEHCAEVIRCAEAVLPPNYLETSNYFYYMGMLHTELLAKHQKRNAGADQKERTSDIAETSRKAQEAFRRCLEMRSVWFGSDHPCTLKVRDKMEASRELS